MGADPAAGEITSTDVSVCGIPDRNAARTSLIVIFRCKQPIAVLAKDPVPVEMPPRGRGEPRDLRACDAIDHDSKGTGTPGKCHSLWSGGMGRRSMAASG